MVADLDGVRVPERASGLDRFERMTTLGEAGTDRLGHVGFELDPTADRRHPGVEPVVRRDPPPASADRSAGVLPESQQTREQLEHDLGLGLSLIHI